MLESTRYCFVGGPFFLCAVAVAKKDHRLHVSKFSHLGLFGVLEPPSGRLEWQVVTKLSVLHSPLAQRAAQQPLNNESHSRKKRSQHGHDAWE